MGTAEGMKFDQGKARWHLLPWGAVYEAMRSNPSRDLTVDMAAYQAYGDVPALARCAKYLLETMDLAPFRALSKVVEVLEHGARKYTENNWHKVGKARYKDAICRHLVDVGLDRDSGLEHRAMAATNALFLLWFEQQEQDNVNECAADPQP